MDQHDRNPPRGPQRRNEDLNAEVGLWAYWLAVHRGKVVAVLTLAASLLTWVATTAGYRYIGPHDDIRRIDSTINVVRSDLASVKASNVLRDAERAVLREQLEFLTYLACQRVPAADAYAKDKCTRLRGKM